MRETIPRLAEIQEARQYRRGVRLILDQPFSALMVVLGFILVLACCSAPLWHRDPVAQDYQHLLQGPHWGHNLGTDQLGRDLLARLLYAGRTSLGLTALILFSQMCLGLVLGLIAGYNPRLDGFLMRLADVMLSLPTLLVIGALVGSVGSGPALLWLCISLTGWPVFARLVRSYALPLRGGPMLEAAQALGGTTSHILKTHVLPQVLGPLLVQGSLQAGHLLLLIASFSFLGFGLPPPNSEWGTMLSEARNLISTSPHLLYLPGLAIVISVLACQSLANLLERWLDPYS